MSTSDKLIGALMIVGIAVVLSALFAIPMMFLWNLCLVPAVTVLKEVSWMQMWGILLFLGYALRPAFFKATS